MPAGSRPRKRTAATAAASAESSSIAPSACSSSAALGPATQVSHFASSTGSGAGSGSDTASQQPQQQPLPAGPVAADHLDQDDAESAPPKRKRGRPRKLVYFVSNTNILNETHADDEDREYEKLRKINHNVIERRRRDQINQSITELAEMLPMSIHQGAALNKLNTLKLSVDFVRQLTAQNQELLVERQVMRTMLQDRGVDWKTVEVAIAEHRAQMSAAEAEQQAQQQYEFQNQSGLPRLLPSTGGGQVAIAASKAQAQQLHQQQQQATGSESAAPAASSSVGAAGSIAAVEQQQQQQPMASGAEAGHFRPTATGFVSNESRWLPNTTTPGYALNSAPVPAPIPLLPVPNMSSYNTTLSSSIMFGRVASSGNTPPSTPGASPALPPQPVAAGGGLVALASVACAMGSAPPSPAVSTSSIPVTGNAPLRLPPPSSSSLSLPLPNSSAPIGSFAQTGQDQRQQVHGYPNHSPFHPLNSANSNQQEQHMFSAPTSAASSPLQPQPVQLAPAAASCPTGSSSSTFSLPPTSGSPATGYATISQSVQYQSQPGYYPPAQAQQPQMHHQQQQPHQQQYFYYSAPAPHARQVGNVNSVSSTPMVGTGGAGTWTSGPGFLN